MLVREIDDNDGQAFWVNHGQTGPAYLLTVNKHDNDNHKMLFIE